MAHVLVVDDEVLCALGVKSHLESLGHRVTIAFTVMDAIRSFDMDPADAVVTDFRMPRMDGKDLVRYLRDRSRDLPILILTGYAPDAEAVCRSSDPPIAVLDKPAVPQVLNETLASLLARSGKVLADQTSISA
ncbi:MAG TPA: response regulator [Azospirillaceae bacterium]|nr:response regulator [Azospirillaceae bacterium]